MYRIWIGLEPRMIMSLLGTALSAMCLVIHLFAFDVLGYPKNAKMKWNPPASAQGR
ncbi:MAG: hypothetical protein SFW08_05805 [Gemmatimonadaceae bacterium]|jgi:hypothetical protein|nr:hypothetical protein [Gemmatimonadaceae bacterium]